MRLRLPRRPVLLAALALAAPACKGEGGGADAAIDLAAPTGGDLARPIRTIPADVEDLGLGARFALAADPGVAACARLAAGATLLRERLPNAGPGQVAAAKKIKAAITPVAAAFGPFDPVLWGEVGVSRAQFEGDGKITEGELRLLLADLALHLGRGGVGIDEREGLRDALDGVRPLGVGPADFERSRKLAAELIGGLADLFANLQACAPIP